MANVANLNITMTASDATFSTAIDKANAKSRDFSNTLNVGSGSLAKFGEKLTSTRSGIYVMAAAAGTSAGALGHLVHGFELAPGPIGFTTRPAFPTG